MHPYRFNNQTVAHHGSNATPQLTLYLADLSLTQLSKPKEREREIEKKIQFYKLKICEKFTKLKGERNRLFSFKFIFKFTNLMLDIAVLIRVKKDFYGATKNVTNLSYFMYSN